MISFICIGFDIRKFPCENWFSADSSEWERDDSVYAEILSRYNCIENEFGIITIANQQELDKISSYILKEQFRCSLVAIEIPEKIVEFMALDGLINFNPHILDISQFQCHGFDICDLEELHTIFNHELIGKFQQKNGLITEPNIVLALEVAQLANVVVTDHLPCIVVKVSSLSR